MSEQGIGTPEEGDEQVALTDEQREQAEKDEAAGFASVFPGAADTAPAAAGTDTVAAAAGDDTTTGVQGADTVTGAKADDTTAAGAAAVSAPAKQPWEEAIAAMNQRFEQLANLPGQFDRLAGNFGGLKRDITASLATAKAAAERKGGDAPTDAQIAQALLNEEDLKKLEEDFPEFGKPIRLIATKLTALEGAKAAPVDMKAMREESERIAEEHARRAEAKTRELVRVDAKHPEWEKTINTPEFKSWVLDGGPSAEAYEQMKTIGKTDPAKATAILNGFAIAHPQWWADRGAYVFDPSSGAAIKLLDAYDAHVKAKAKPNKNRLEASVPATAGGSGARPAALSERDAAQKGFDAVFNGP